MKIQFAKMTRIITMLTLLAALAGCVPVSAPASTPGASVVTAPTAAAAETIELAMGYIPSVQFAPFYVAVEKGFYREEGLEVKFRYGFESDLIKLVGSNELQFMIGSGEEVILGRAQGLPVVYAMSWYRKFPVVIFAPTGSGLDTPAKLIGHKIGIPGLFGASYVGWKALVYATQLDESKVSLQSIGFTQAAAVQSQQVDAALDYSVNGPVQMRLAGQEVDEIFVADYVDLPSNGIITNDKTVAEQPELVRRFVRATLRGLEYTLVNPDGAFALSLQQVPEAGADETARKTNRAIFDEVLKLWQTEGVLGFSDPGRWETAARFMQAMGLITTAVKPETLYTNQFVETR
ncbi:MAG: ABC transporter substrate-binding protein [Anaerolineae bacterium]